MMQGNRSVDNRIALNLGGGDGITMLRVQAEQFRDNDFRSDFLCERILYC